jgi:GntR family transcriptional regulator
MLDVTDRDDLATQIAARMETSSAPSPAGRLRAALEGLIADKVLLPGQYLPSERELVELTGLSRGTVRTVIAALSQQQLVRAVHGRGSVVLATTEFNRVLIPGKRYINPQTDLPYRGISMEITVDELRDSPNRRGEPTVEFISADAELAALLNVHEGVELCRRTATIYLGTDAVMIVTMIAERRWTQGTVMEDRERSYPGQPDEALESHGFKLSYEEQFRPRGATQAEADALNLAVGTPVLAVMRLARDEGGQVRLVTFSAQTPRITTVIKNL